MRLSVTAADKAEYDRQKLVRRYVGWPEKNLPGDLFAFCTEVLGYNALTEAFHGPQLSEMDKQDLKRFRQWLGLHTYKEPLDDLVQNAREHIKTWVQRARLIRYLLWSHTLTACWVHAIEDEALKSGAAVAEQLQHNDELRKLFLPGILPSKQLKKFYSDGKFRLGKRAPGSPPTLICVGAGAESTGIHTDIGIADDFVGYNDVVDSQMPKKLSWFQGTFCNIVMKENQATERTGWKDVICTPWAVDDPYVWMEESGHFRVTKRPCLSETPMYEGQKQMTVGEYTGYPAFLTEKEIRKQYEMQGPLFAYQMMCDRTAKQNRPWDSTSCEHYCTLKEAEGQGHVVLLTDPAPRAVGSVGGRDERWRKDGTKNWWVNVTVKLRRKGELRQMIWLGGERSRDWNLDEGMDSSVKLGMKWHAKDGYAETTNTPVYAESFYRAKREWGWKGHAIGSAKKFNPDDRLKQTYNADAKNTYITALCSRAKDAEFLICETVPKDLVDEFLRQVRGFMPQAGKTGVPFDDVMNALAFATDPYFSSKYQAVSEEFSQSPFKVRDEEDEFAGGSRYVRF